ncbi:MAG: hypothetical protein CO032_03115 [Nitrosopumilales archaeon CG_4_9_14_0_2_um_filter_34_16]|nr:MAG: hypothetical protein CO032_03115 [Nitrosopumilales archaeon CG_4_9_14_0_2_um_filter_34_16]
MQQIIKIIFSDSKYIVLSAVIFTVMIIGLLLISEYIFLEPYVTGHIPKGTEFGFSLIIVLSGLSALVIPMNIYRINVMRTSKRKIGGSVFGSLFGAAAGACSCGPIGFAVISTFGTIGATTSAFLTNYELPIRIAAIALLILTLYTTQRSLRMECKILQ